jgi:hypothetical protein
VQGPRRPRGTAHAADVARWPPADVAIERIGEPLQYDLETLVRRKT